MRRLVLDSFWLRKKAAATAKSTATTAIVACVAQYDPDSQVFGRSNEEEKKPHSKQITKHTHTHNSSGPDNIYLADNIKIDAWMCRPVCFQKHTQSRNSEINLQNKWPHCFL